MICYTLISCYHGFYNAEHTVLAGKLCTYDFSLVADKLPNYRSVHSCVVPTQYVIVPGSVM